MSGKSCNFLRSTEGLDPPPPLPEYILYVICMLIIYAYMSMLMNTEILNQAGYKDNTGKKLMRTFIIYNNFEIFLL